MLPSAEFWKGKRVLLTGHTGFKGTWLALWLGRLGAQVTGIALPPATEPALFDAADVGAGVDSHFLDIRDPHALAHKVQGAHADIVLHLAAQALVRASYRAPLDTFASNVMGTAHLLDALRGSKSVKVAVVVTTDKVYRNRETVLPYRESDALGGHDPYSASKAAAEIVTACYRDAFLGPQGVAVATARAGNVIGGGDWSEDRLIPDAVRAWSSGSTLSIRRPNAVRPWQHVLEPLCGYLRLAESLWQRPTGTATAFNFGPRTDEAASVGEVVRLARASFGRGETVFGDGSGGPHEAGLLALETALARTALGVAPRWSLDQSVARTMQWYRRFGEGSTARSLCDADITDYEAVRA